MNVRLSGLLLMCTTTWVMAVESPSHDTERIAALEQQVAALTAELENDVFGDVLPALGEPQHGLGVAASKVYHQDQGLSIGGYGEGLYQNFDGFKTDEADFLRAVIYLGFKFNENWVMNTELEFEHASTSEDGSASVEFAYLDRLYRPELNFRAGLLLVPVGIVNELHEPTAFLSAKRSMVESRIIPTTWRENGAGIFGDLGMVRYNLYVVNSLDGENFTGAGLRGGRQKGSQAKAEDWSVVGRVDVQPSASVLLGGSVYHGNQGQDLGVDAQTTMIEGHAVASWGGLKLNALAVMARIDGADALSRIINAADLGPDGILPPDNELDAVGEEMFGWYVELGYDLLVHADDGETSLTPFIRYENLNTQDEVPSGFTAHPENDLEIISLGINYQPIDEIVFKVEHQLIEDGNGESFDQTNLAMGFIF